MTNFVTDQFNIVQKRQISCLPFMVKTLKPDTDHSLLVFHGAMPGNYIQPEHIAPNARGKVQNGDTVIAVSNATRYYKLSGAMTTRDNYHYHYEIPIALTVKDGYRVACDYFQELDPVQVVINQLQKLVKQYTSSVPFDKLHGDRLPLSYWSDTELTPYGFTISQSEKAAFYEDPQHTGPDIEILKIQRSLQVKLKELYAEQQIKDYQEEQKRRNEEILHEFERQEETKNQLYQICKDLRKKAAEETIIALQARIQEEFAGGESANQISNMYFTLLEIFQGPKHMDIEQNVIAAGLSSGKDNDKDRSGP